MQHLWATQRVSFVNVPFVVFSLSGYQKQRQKKIQALVAVHILQLIFLLVFLLLLFSVCLFVLLWLSQGQHSLIAVSYGWSGYIQHTISNQSKKKRIKILCAFLFLSDRHHICLPFAWLECTGRRLLYNTNLPTVGNQKPINLLPHIP